VAEFPAGTKKVYVVFDYAYMAGEEVRVGVSEVAAMLSSMRPGPYPGMGQNPFPSGQARGDSPLAGTGWISIRAGV
jgi:hypothetical protein